MEDRLKLYDKIKLSHEIQPTGGWAVDAPTAQRPALDLRACWMGLLKVFALGGKILTDRS